MGRLNHRNSGCRVFRNNVGSYPTESGRWIEYGLAPGSADLVGLITRVITPEDVGQTLSQFLAVEVKTPIGRLSKEQKAWLGTIKGLGGLALVMRSAEEAESFLRSMNHG